jgi:hypothetical protein
MVHNPHAKAFQRVRPRRHAKATPRAGAGKARRGRSLPAMTARNMPPGKEVAMRNE